MCIALSLRGIEAFAHYLSDSTAVAKITQTMWKVCEKKNEMASPMSIDI